MDEKPLLGKNYQVSEKRQKNIEKESLKEKYQYQKALNRKTISREQRKAEEETRLFFTELFQKDEGPEKIEQYHARMVGLACSKSEKQSFVNEEFKSYLSYWATLFKNGSLTKDALNPMNTPKILFHLLSVSLEKSAMFLTSKYGTIRSLYELSANTKSSFLVYPAFFTSENTERRKVGGVVIRKFDDINYEIIVIDKHNTYFKDIRNKELEKFLSQGPNVALTRYLVPTVRTHLIADLLTSTRQSNNKFSTYDGLDKISVQKEFRKYEEVDTVDKGDIKNFECAVNYAVCSAIFNEELLKEPQMLSLPENVEIIHQLVIDHLTGIEKNSPTFTSKQKNNLAIAIKNIKASDLSYEKSFSIHEKKQIEEKKLSAFQKSMDTNKKHRKLPAKSGGIDNPAFYEKAHSSDSPTI